MTFRDDNTSQEFERYPEYLTKDISISDLNSLCRRGSRTEVVSDCPANSSDYSTYAVFELPMAGCGLTSSYTLIRGHTMVLRHGCQNLYPATVTGVLGCPSGVPPPGPLQSQPEPMQSQPEPVQSQAVGDPHLVNMLGQRFDIKQPGTHKLLQIPSEAGPGAELLRVMAEVVRVGAACGDLYFSGVNITGRWVHFENGLHFYAYSGTRHLREWLRLGPVSMKVVDGNTRDGVHYLNIFVRQLSSSGFPIGGLLGADDFTLATAPDDMCKHSLSLLGVSSTAGPGS